MSDTYKGYPYPEIIFDDGWFYAIDEKFGFFWGYKEEVVLLFWRNKVDSVLKVDAVDVGLYEELPDGDLKCEDCGARVIDIAKHSDFHKRIRTL